MALYDILDDYQLFNSFHCDSLDEMDFLKNSKTNINIIHFNIRSIKKNYDDLVAFLESTTVEFGMIILSETNIVHDLDSFGIDGFDIFYNDSQQNKCDGTIALVKSVLLPSFEIVQVRKTKFLRTVLTKNNVQIGVTAVYRLPSLNADEFVIDLQTLLEEHIVKNPLEVFCGDININLMDEGNETTCNYLNCLNGLGYVSMINSTTRQDRLSRSCIDHFFVYNRLGDSSIKPVVLNCGLTDHFPILLNIDFKTANGQSINEGNNSPLLIKRLDCIKLQSQIKNQEWDSVCDIDINLCTENFIQILNNCITSSTQLIKIKNVKKKKEWITRGIIASIKHRDKLKKIADRTPQSVEAIEKFRKYRNNLTNLIKKSKYMYFKNRLAQCGNDIKKTWEVIKQATNETRKCKGITLIKNENKLVYDNREIADVFLEYFGSIGKNLANKIKKNNYRFLNKRISNSLFFNPITENELISAINSLKTKASPGDDNISAKLLKDNHIYLLKPLLHLINLIFEKGTYPEILKKAVIVPIYKTGDRLNKENYRPIAMTSSVSRLFEKCIKLRLDSFLNTNNILSKSQYGFLSGVSSEEAMVHVTDYVLQNYNNKFKTLGIFVDLARAFDTVAHEILLKKLEDIGVRGLAHSLFESYLKNRTQRIRINDSLSKTGTVEFGVPQGTVLGPTLFSLYINDLFSVLPNENSECVCYADDTVILVRGKSWPETFQRAEDHISKVRLWMDQNLLTMNVNKTVHMAFSMNNPGGVIHPELRVHNFECVMDMSVCRCEETILAKDSVKYLGVFIDKNLRYETHVNYITKKIRKTVHKFYQLREFLSLKLLKMTYQALIESVLMYGLSVWGSACCSILHRLNITQKYIIKIFMNRNRRYPSDLLFKEADLLPVRQLYVKGTLRFMKKCNKYKSRIMHSVHTRSVDSGCLFVPLASYTASQRHIRYVGPKLFNMLPLNLKSVVNLRTFLLGISKWIKINYQQITYTVPLLNEY